MKNSVLSLFKKKNSSNNASNSGESDDATLSPSTSQNSLNNGGSPHSGSFSNLSDLLQQNGSLVYNSLPETTLSYGHIQTPFNLFELNRRMYQTNSQVLLQKQANSNSNSSNGNNVNGGNNRMSLSNQQATPQPIALTPSLLMGKRKELNRVSTQSPTADITPRSSSPSITTTSTPTNSTIAANNNSTTNSNTNINGNSSATPSTPTPTNVTTESTTPTIKTIDSSPTVKTTTTTSAVTVVNSNIIKTVLSDQDKLIGLISSYLIPHKDHLKSRESLSSQQFLSILLLNKKWNSIVLANDLPSIHDDIVKLWAILVEEMYEPAANIENDHMSKKFIELYCKQHNIEMGSGSSSIPSTPTSATNVSTPTGTKATGTATGSATNRKVQKPVEVLNPQDFYSVDLSQLTYKPDPDTSIVIQENQIEHASLNKLIEELTSHTTYDIHFLHTFMLTFRNFTDKETILKKLEERFNYPPNCPAEEFANFKREILDKIRLRIINSIKYWIENFFVFDFDSEMMQFLSNFIEMVRKSNQSALAKVIENTLERVKNNDSGKVFTKVECPEILKLKKKVFSKKKTYSILDYPLQEVARQMSLIDYAMFKKIEPKECLNQAWNKEHRVTKAPNISRMIHHFNQFSGFVATEILKQEDQEKRVKCVEKFIELANHCKGLNNFNAVFSIMSGLNSSSIHRLSKTWEAISEESKKIREELLAITNTNGNFANLRNMLKSVNPPCVPYNGVFLTDLTFIEDGSPKYINGLINFGKCRLFAKVIRDIQTYQNTRYNFEEYKELKDQIESVEKLTEDELFNISLQVQPRAQKKKKPAATNASASSLKDDDDDEKKPEKLDF